MPLKSVCGAPTEFYEAFPSVAFQLGFLTPGTRCVCVEPYLVKSNSMAKGNVLKNDPGLVHLEPFKNLTKFAI